MSSPIVRSISGRLDDPPPFCEKQIGASGHSKQYQEQRILADLVIRGILLDGIGQRNEFLGGSQLERGSKPLHRD